MATSFGVGYDDLQPITRRVRLDVVPLLVGESTRHAVIGGLNGLHYGLIEHPDLGVSLDDMTPPLLGQLDHPPAGIVDPRANRHDLIPSVSRQGDDCHAGHFFFRAAEPTRKPPEKSSPRGKPGAKTLGYPRSLCRPLGRVGRPLRVRVAHARE